MTPPKPSQKEKKEALVRLKKARAAIHDPKAWCQGHYALSSKGSIVPPTAKNAVCFCAYGAVMSAIPDIGDDILWETCYAWLYQALKTILPEDDEPSLQVYNDCHKHEEVVALFDKAIDIAKEDANAKD